MVPFLLAMVLFLVGVYAIAAKRNIIKVVLGLMVVEYAANLMLVLNGYLKGGEAPIVDRAGQSTAGMVDPLPQALVLTSIVIGLSVTAMVIAISLRIYERYKTFDILKIRRLRG